MLSYLAVNETAIPVKLPVTNCVIKHITAQLIYGFLCSIFFTLNGVFIHIIGGGPAKSLIPFSLLLIHIFKSSICTYCNFIKTGLLFTRHAECIIGITAD